MPNWSFNRMYVAGMDDAQKAEVKRLRDTIKSVDKFEDGTEVPTPFSFNKIIPMPKELENTKAPVDDPDSEENKALRAKYGFDNWYDWRWENWGTKWDACDVEDESESDDELAIKFDTAWSFPTPVVVKLSQMFPTLTFTYDAEEESGMYDFTVEFKNGKVTYYAEWEHDEDGCRTDEVSKPVENFWK